MCASANECHHPTPPYPMWCVCGWLWGGKNDAKLCLCVLVTPVCVRGWLWKMAVCARDSSLCARVTLGRKNDAKLCLCVLVTPECVRGWPPDLVMISILSSLLSVPIEKPHFDSQAALAMITSRNRRKFLLWTKMPKNFFSAPDKKRRVEGNGETSQDSTLDEILRQKAWLQELSRWCLPTHSDYETRESNQNHHAG